MQASHHRPKTSNRYLHPVVSLVPDRHLIISLLCIRRVPQQRSNLSTVSARPQSVQRLRASHYLRRRHPRLPRRHVINVSNNTNVELRSRPTVWRRYDRSSLDIETRRPSCVIQLMSLSCYSPNNIGSQSSELTPITTNSNSTPDSQRRFGSDIPEVHLVAKSL